MIFLAPVLPGKVDSLKRLVSTLNAEKHADFEDSQRRAGVSKETWFLQPTEQEGGLAVVHFEGKDMMKSFQMIVQSQHPFDQWIRKQVTEITGIDFSKPFSRPLPQQLLKYES